MYYVLERIDGQLYFTILSYSKMVELLWKIKRKQVNNVISIKTWRV